MSQPLRYPKPLSLTDRLLIETVTARYEGIGESWVAFDKGDYIELRCPRDLRLSEQRLNELKRETQAVHGIPGNGGSVDSSC